MNVIGWPVKPEDPAPQDVVGEMATSTDTGKNVGRRVVSTSLAGSWMGNSRSMLIQAPQVLGDNDSGRLVKEAGHGQMWFFLNPDGSWCGYADVSRDGGRLIRGFKFCGRLFKVSDYCFNLINGVEGEPGWGEAYYPVFLNPARDFATIFILDSHVAFAGNQDCKGYGPLFIESHWFSKISDEVDLEIMREVRSISDQWLYQPQPEDGADPVEEQWPTDCA